jgi:hypothetical protein
LDRKAYAPDFRLLLDRIMMPARNTIARAENFALALALMGDHDSDPRFDRARSKALGALALPKSGKTQTRAV